VTITDDAVGGAVVEAPARATLAPLDRLQHARPIGQQDRLVEPSASHAA
jgi:hypothetical protein